MTINSCIAEIKNVWSAVNSTESGKQIVRSIGGIAAWTAYIALCKKVQKDQLSFGRILASCAFFALALQLHNTGKMGAMEFRAKTTEDNFHELLKKHYGTDDLDKALDAYWKEQLHTMGDTEDEAAQETAANPTPEKSVEEAACVQ
jgi:hypothetical protein